MRAGSRGLPLVKSAIRAIEVLELFSREKRALALSEIIEALGYPQSSTTMILKSMLAIGYLNYNLEAKTYYPNISVTRLGDWITETNLIEGPIQRLMEDMFARTTESVTIAVQNDVNVHFLSVLYSHHEAKTFLPSKGQRTLLQSNLGMMLLALKTNKEIASIHGQICLMNVRRIPPLDEIMSQIEQIRCDGYSYIPHLPIMEAASAAMLLPCYLHNQPLVVGVGGYVPRLEANLSKIIIDMRAAISDFQDTLGGTNEINVHN